MIIRKRIYAEFDKYNKWSIDFRDEDGSFINMMSIPPTNGSRTDIFLEKRESSDRGGIIIEHEYLYNFKGNIKKLKGEKIIIDIKNGIPFLICSEK